MNFWKDKEYGKKPARETGGLLFLLGGGTSRCAILCPWRQEMPPERHSFLHRQKSDRGFGRSDYGCPPASFRPRTPDPGFTRAHSMTASYHTGAREAELVLSSHPRSVRALTNPLIIEEQHLRGWRSVTPMHRRIAAQVTPPSEAEGGIR